MLGGVVTGWYTLRANKQMLEHESEREERERQLSFRKEQLDRFYGPALACMEELEECWHLLFEAEKSVEQFRAKHLEQKGSDDLLQEKKRAVLAYKQYLYEREVTVFNKVKDIFVDNFGLAEVSTKDKYRVVVRFIENRNIIRITEKQLDLSFTGEDTSGIREKLGLLFDNLDKLSSQIRQQIERGEPKPLALDDRLQVVESEKREEPGTADIVARPQVPAPSKKESVVVSDPIPAPQTHHGGESKARWAGHYTTLGLKNLGHLEEQGVVSLPDQGDPAQKQEIELQPQSTEDTAR